MSAVHIVSAVALSLIVAAWVFVSNGTDQQKVDATSVKINRSTTPEKSLGFSISAPSSQVNATNNPAELAATSHTASLPQHLTEAGQPADQPTLVNIRQGRLTVRVRAGSLESVLGEISRRAQIPIIVAAELSGELISTDLVDVPMDEGLQKLLSHFDVFVLYRSGPQALNAIKAVWVYPRGKAENMQPVPPEAWTSTLELVRNLDDTSPAVRVRAIEALVERKGQQAQEALLRVLTDSDEEVRTRALIAATSSGVDLPADKLLQLMQWDASAAVRLIALAALSSPEYAARQSTSMAVIADLALRDSDASVREQGRQLSDALEKIALSPQSEQDEQQVNAATEVR